MIYRIDGPGEVSTCNEEVNVRCIDLEHQRACSSNSAQLSQKISRVRRHVIPYTMSAVSMYVYPMPQKERPQTKQKRVKEFVVVVVVCRLNRSAKSQIHVMYAFGHSVLELSEPLLEVSNLLQAGVNDRLRVFRVG